MNICKNCRFCHIEHWIFETGEHWYYHCLRRIVVKIPNNPKKLRNDPVVGLIDENTEKWNRPPFILENKKDNRSYDIDYKATQRENPDIIINDDTGSFWLRNKRKKYGLIDKLKGKHREKDFYMSCEIANPKGQCKLYEKGRPVFKTDDHRDLWGW